MLNIYFNNIKNILLRKKIKKIFNLALKIKIDSMSQLAGQDFEVSLRYVSKEDIKKINQEFRDINKVTDVLSFPIIDFSNNDDIELEIKEKNPTLLLGDIVICRDVAKKQSKLFKHSFNREMCFLALHGFLHLLGYDHIEKEDEKIMQEMAERILQNFNIRR